MAAAAKVTEAKDLVAQPKREIVDLVESKITDMQTNGQIHFPANYSPQNALRSAWLILQETKDTNRNPVLESCTRDSVANALLNTVIQGLSPAKKQVYYIAYGKNLTCMRSYFGTMAIVKRLEGVEDIFAQVVYEDDTFEFMLENGTKRITKHETALANMEPDKIVAAYATILMSGGKQYTEIMTMPRIKRSWAKSKSPGTQKEFPEEMAMRTVINRACKTFVNTSDDSDLIIEAFHATDGAGAREDAVEAEVQANANVIELDIDTGYEVVDDSHGLAKEPVQQVIEDPGF